MTATTTDRASRPRVEGEREQEILDGAIDLLSEVGYDRLTFDTLAAHVRASKATLYRKWDSKPELVMAAVEHLFHKSTGPHGEAPDTGTLVGDLEAVFCESAPMLDQLPGVLAATLPALHRDPELKQLFVDRFLKPKLANLTHMLGLAQARGELGPDADLPTLASILPAMNFHRVLVEGVCPDEAYVRNVIHEVLLPACRATLRD